MQYPMTLELGHRIWDLRISSERDDPEIIPRPIKGVELDTGTATYASPHRPLDFEFHVLRARNLKDGSYIGGLSIMAFMLTQNGFEARGEPLLQPNPDAYAAASMTRHIWLATRA